MEGTHGRLPGRRNDPLRRLFRSGLGCRKGKLRLFGNMRVTRLESLEPRTPQSRAQPINQSRDFHFTDTAALQIQLRWGKRFGSRHAQSHQIEAKARIERTIRSEERRVGKECVSTGSARWSRDHQKKYTRKDGETSDIRNNN